ncbi:MAG: (2Fe-2S)-binding protein [Firmicutes bacterium]|nr:(2Fe-2S)-binding protein [Bacillota bacterium]
MYQNDPKHDPAYEVCLCRKITRADVEAFIRESGVKTLPELCRQMPVGDKCGGCREDLDMILTEVLAAAN